MSPETPPGSGELATPRTPALESTMLATPALARTEPGPARPPALADQLARADLKALLFGAPAESTRIGRFAVLRKLGAGGMGVVYEAQSLVQALREIPVEDQVVLELMYFEGLSGSELAGVLGLPEGTVRGRLARGKQRLRDRVAALLARAPQAAQLPAVSPEQLDVWALELRRQQGWS